MTAQRRKQVEEESEKNFRISTWRRIPFQKMCMFPLQGLTRLAAYPISIHSLLHRTLIWAVGRWHCVSYRTQIWGAIHLSQWNALKSPGFLGDSLKAGLPFLPSSSSFLLRERRCDPEGGPLLLQVNSSQVKQAKLKGRKAVMFSPDSCVTKCIPDLLKPLFIQGFHYVQLSRLLTGKWFILNFSWESKPYIFTSFSFMVLITFSN